MKIHGHVYDICVLQCAFLHFLYLWLIVQQTRNWFGSSWFGVCTQTKNFVCSSQTGCRLYCDIICGSKGRACHYVISRLDTIASDQMTQKATDTTANGTITFWFTPDPMSIFLVIGDSLRYFMPSAVTRPYKIWIRACHASRRDLLNANHRVNDQLSCLAGIINGQLWVH